MSMLKLHSLEDYAKLVADNWEVKPPTDEDLKREDASSTGKMLTKLFICFYIKLYVFQILNILIFTSQCTNLSLFSNKYLSIINIIYANSFEIFRRKCF